MPTAKISPRFSDLDSLRGVAVLMVVLFHLTFRYNQIYGFETGPLVLFPYGFLGVDLFFMISGYVIFMTIEKAKKPLDFVIARIARLYPSYWTAVLLTFTVVSIFSLPGREVSLYNAILNLSMLQSWIFVPPVDGVYWTLVVEIEFYIVILLLFIFKKLKSVEKFGFYALFFIVLVHLLPVPFKSQITSIFIIKYFNLFLAGILFYKIKNEGNSLNKNMLLFCCLIIQFIVSDIARLTVIFLFFSVFYLTILEKLTILKNKLIQYVGLISYPLYLIHQNIGYVIIRTLSSYHVNNILLLVIPIIITTLIAMAIHHIIEDPFRKLIRDYYANKIKIDFDKKRIIVNS
ncbi:MAG: acyltransferase [Nanoarchaeota archaeon]